MSEPSPNARTRPDLPVGMLTLLFTDIEGSTALLQALGEAYPAQLEAHRRILRASFAAQGGIEVDTQGDAFFAVFRSVKSAIAAATQAQRELQAFPWPPDHPLRVRMGLHCGEPMPTGEGYVGVDLHRGARLMSAAHGGQVLLSSAAGVWGGDLPSGTELRDRGEHRLKDFRVPEHIFELCIDGLLSDFPPLRTLDNLSHNLPAHLTPILGREQEIEAKNRCRALHFLIQSHRHRANWAPYRVRLEQLETLARDAQMTEFQAIALDQRMWDEVGAGHIDAALEYCALVVELRQKCVEQADEQSPGAREIERCQIELNDAMILQVEILARAGRFKEAWALMEEALSLKRASGDESGLTFGLYKYAQLMADTGRIAEARPIFEEVVQRAEKAGDRSVMLAWYRYDAAKVALHEGDLARGRELVRASYAVFEENASTVGFLLTLHILVYLQGLEGHWPLVARTLGAGDALRGAPYPTDWHTILQTQESAARAALGDEEFETQRASGAQLDPQMAIEAALANRI